VLFQIDSLASDLCPVCDSLGITDIPHQLLASGDVRLDDAQVVAAGEQLEAAPPAKPSKPGKGKGKGPIKATENPGTLVPGDAPATNGPGTGSTPGKGPKDTPSVTVTTAIPTVGVPTVDDLVKDVVDGVGTVLDGLGG
jgi:hypothetical protein